MKTIACLPAVLLLCIAPQALRATPQTAATAAPKALGAAWIGSWEGFCTVVPVETGSTGFRMKLDVKPLAGRPGYTWVIDYNELSHFTQESRNYELLPAADSDATHFIMDEKTGLMLDSFLVGETLYSAYYVGGKLYALSYELGPEGLAVRGPVYEEEVLQSTCLVGSTRLCAKSLQFSSVQNCHLKRK